MDIDAELSTGWHTDPLYISWLTEAKKYENQTNDYIRVLREDSGEETGGEGFLTQELTLAAVLGTATGVQATQVIKLYEEWVQDGRLETFDEFLARATNVMQGTFTTSVAQKTEDLITDVVSSGGGAVSLATEVMDLPRMTDIIGGMVDSTKYYTNEYFNRLVVPSMQQAVVNFLQDNTDPEEVYRVLRNTLDTRLKSVPYWRMVSNSATSRGYHYGVVKAGQVSGYRGYEIAIVEDDRTSDICLNMKGRKFWLADAVQQVERVARAEKEELKTEAPWLSYKQIEEMDNAALKDAGFIMPPFHGNCRSTIRLLRD